MTDWVDEHVRFHPPEIAEAGDIRNIVRRSRLGRPGLDITIEKRDEGCFAVGTAEKRWGAGMGEAPQQGVTDVKRQIQDLLLANGYPVCDREARNGA